MAANRPTTARRNMNSARNPRGVYIDGSAARKLQGSARAEILSSGTASCKAACQSGSKPPNSGKAAYT